MARRVRRVRRASAGGALVAIVLAGFVVNGALRMPCYDVCGSDVGRLYEDRGIDRHHAPFFERDLEYPPIIGLVMYAAVLPFDHGLRGPFLINALLLTALALLTTWLLWRRHGTATRRWALAPPLLLQGLTNWDLLAVAPATIALVQWESGAALSAGLLLGVGTAAKLYPALFVPVLVAACVPARASRAARDVIVGAIVGVAAFTVPVYAAAPHALAHFLDFHRVRTPSRGAIWFYVFRTPAMHPWLSHADLARLMNVATAVIVGAALIALVVTVARDRLSPIAACALVTIVFVVANKIYSPQYDLWIVPFLVMVPVRRKLVVNFYVSSTLVWLAISSASTVAHAAHLYLTGAVVVYRLVVLAAIASEMATVDGRRASACAVTAMAAR